MTLELIIWGALFVGAPFWAAGNALLKINRELLRIANALDRIASAQEGLEREGPF